MKNLRPLQERIFLSNRRRVKFQTYKILLFPKATLNEAFKIQLELTYYEVKEM